MSGSDDAINVTQAKTVGERPDAVAGRRRLPQPRQVAERAGKLVLNAVDEGIVHRWEPAQRRAEAYANTDREVALRHLRKSFRTELGVAGAAAGGAAAVPITAGPAVAVGVAEIGWSTVRLADLILTIAVLHGHDRASVEERRAWVLSVLAFGDGAAKTFAKLAAEAGKGLGKKATTAIPAKTLQAVNRAIGRTIVTKYGAKRGVFVLGRLLPLGIGAGIGFGLNVALVEQVARHADKFFEQLPAELSAALAAE